MRILSWNVNGLRAVHKKGFAAWLREADAAVLGLQEVRADPARLAPEIHTPEITTGLRHVHYTCARRPGYSGVALYAREALGAVVTSLGEEEFDVEGRFQCVQLGDLVICNVYFPNGSGQGRDNSRIPYKLRFYQRVFAQLAPALERGAPILVMGDFNTAHREIDLARPRENAKTSGFCPEERAELDRWLQNGFVDTFRAFDATPGRYTWWSQRAGVRERNIGWRIDYVLASEAAMPYIRDAFILPEVRGSDHCPVGVDIDEAVCGKRASLAG